MELIGLYSCAILGFVSTYVVGYAFLLPFYSTRELPSEVIFFIKLALGFVLIPTISALIHTNGYTVLQIVPVLYTVTLILNRESAALGKTFSTNLEGRMIALGVCFLSVFLSIQLFRNGYFNKFAINASYLDFGVYCTAAEYLMVSGIEVSSPWYQVFELSSDKLAKPYHYDDLWLLSYLFSLKRGSPLDVYIYAYTPLVCTFNAFSNIALFRMFSSSKKYTYIYGVLIAFSSVFLNAHIKDVPSSAAYAINVLLTPKIALLPILLTSVFICQKYKIQYLDLFFVTCICFFQCLLLPIISATFLTFWLVAYVLKRQSLNLVKIILFSAFIVSYFVFYFKFGTWTLSSSNTALPDDHSYSFWFAKVFLSAHFWFATYYILAITALIIVFYPTLKHLLSTTSRNADKIIKIATEVLKDGSFQQILFQIYLIFIYSTIIASALIFNPESSQFYKLTHNIIAQLTVVAFMSFACFNHALPPKRTRAICWLLSVFIGYGMYSSIFVHQYRSNPVSRSFLEQTKKRVGEINPLGIGIANLLKTDSYSSDPRMCYFCNFLKQAGNGLWVIQVNIPEDVKYLQYKERAEALKHSPFYIYIQQLKKTDKYNGIINAQIQFINEYNINYAVIEAGAVVPIEILEMADTLFTDDLSKTKVIIFKHKANE